MSAKDTTEKKQPQVITSETHNFVKFPNIKDVVGLPKSLGESLHTIAAAIHDATTAVKSQ